MKNIILLAPNLIPCIRAEEPQCSSWQRSTNPSRARVRTRRTLAALHVVSVHDADTSPRVSESRALLRPQHRAVNSDNPLR